jgi:hypothetical protein
MTKTNTWFMALALILAMVLAATLSLKQAFGKQTLDNPGIGGGVYRVYEFFASTTAAGQIATYANSTSTDVTAYFDSNGVRTDGSFSIRGAKTVQLYFTRGGSFAAANQGTSTFAVQGTPDGTNWYYIRNYSTSTFPTVHTMTHNFSSPFFRFGQTTTGNAATSTFVYNLDLTKENWKAIRCIVTRQVDGANACSASAFFSN